MSARPREAPTASLVVAFLLSTLFFLAATALTLHTSQTIGRAAQDIATTATPAGSPLVEIHSSLRRLDVAIVLSLTGPGLAPPAGHETTDELVAGIDRQLGNYLATPSFPSDGALRPAIRAAWERVRQSYAKVEALDRAGDREAAVQRFLSEYRATIEQFDGALLRCGNANALEADRRARLIERQWTRERVVGLSMTGVSVTLTLATALLAISLVRRQTRLLAQQADESVAFAGRVAHDVLSPLSPVRMLLDIADKRGLDHPAVARGLPNARAAMNRLVATVDALLAFAKAGARPPADATAQVDDVVRGVVADQSADAERLGIELQVEDVAPAEVRCAPGVLGSVLSNLLRNAIKYMGDSSDRRISVTAKPAGHDVRIEVRDTGPGIAPQWQGAIFDPLVRAPNATGQGIGLGLATVKRLVQRHGGDVGLVSAPGQGSRFWITFPQARQGNSHRA